MNLSTDIFAIIKGSPSNEEDGVAVAMEKYVLN